MKSPFRLFSKEGGVWVLVLVFLGIGASFIFDLWGTYVPRSVKPKVQAQFFVNETVRDPLVQPVIHRAGFEFHCNECHVSIAPRESLYPEVMIAAHADIILDHGTNDHCLNCHHKENRESLRDRRDQEIPFAHSEILCRQCHGPKYRDWEAGVHGRPNGYWDLSKGESVKTPCSACHDPHSPRFKPIAPQPAPARPGGNSEQHRGQEA